MIDLTTSEFENNTKDGIVLVDFWASWCGPCKMMTPILEGVSKNFEDDDSVNIYKVNAEEEPEIAKQFQVTSVPTLVFMKNGEVAKVVKGLQTGPVVTEALEALKSL